MASDPAGNARREDVPVALSEVVFPSVRRVLTVVGILGFAVTFLVEVRAGRGGASLWAQGIAFGLTVLSLWTPLSVRLRMGATIVGLLAVGVVALLRYGPLSGNAVIFVASMYLAAVFFGRGGVWVTGAAAFACFVGAGAALSFGVVSFDPLLASDPRRITTWLRTGTTLVLASGGIMLFYFRLIANQQRLADAAFASRLGQEAAERERERAFAALAQSQRLEALGRLAAGAAHDFRNALAVVAASASEIRSARSLEEARPSVEDIELAVRGATRTASHMVTLSRTRPEERVSCPPGRVAADVARTLSRLLPRSIEIATEIEDAPDVAMPEGSLSQVLLNLALNARDAMPDGGRMAVRVGRREGGALLEVRDDGRGMDEETRSRAMQYFFSTKPPGQGSGLGLAMVEDAVSRCGGTLEIDSAPGRGTTVRLHLPAASPVASA